MNHLVNWYSLFLQKEKHFNLHFISINNQKFSKMIYLLPIWKHLSKKALKYLNKYTVDVLSIVLGEARSAFTA